MNSYHKSVSNMSLHVHIVNIPEKRQVLQVIVKFERIHCILYQSTNHSSAYVSEPREFNLFVQTQLWWNQRRSVNANSSVLGQFQIQWGFSRRRSITMAR